MPIRAVFAGMDGTLLNPQHEISDYTATVLKKLKKRGIRFVVATGRPYGEVIEMMKAAELEPDYLITANGARIHDNEYNVVHSHNIPRHTAAALAQIRGIFNLDSGEMETDFVTNVYRNEDWLTNKNVPAISGGVHKNLPCTDLGEGLHALTAGDLEGVHQVWFQGAPEVLEQLESHLNAAHGGDITWTCSSTDMINCGPHGISKGTGVREVVNALSVDLEDIACFGDAMNDESMLKIAGQAFVMENAVEDLKKALPRAQVIGSNADDAVAKKLEDLIFL